MANSLRLRRPQDGDKDDKNVVTLGPVSLTIDWAELPSWAQDNEFITSGYRRVQNGWKGCLHSVFGYLHNETVNIHTHLFGAILFVYLLLTVASSHLSRYPTAWVDHVMFSIFLASTALCLCGSAAFHTASCHSVQVMNSMQRIDHAGIVILIVGSFYPCLYYGFYCERELQAFYIGGITLFGLFAAYIVLNPTYAQPSHRGARTAVFIALGLCAVFPTVHWVIRHGFGKLFTEMGFEWLLLSGALYIGGALLYANRIPERLFPGTFNYFLASHQVFHTAVVGAAICHFLSILKALDYSYATNHPCKA